MDILVWLDLGVRRKQKLWLLLHVQKSHAPHKMKSKIQVTNSINKKQVIKNWSTPEKFHCLKAAVLENLVSGGNVIVSSEVPVCTISRHL